MLVSTLAVALVASVVSAQTVTVTVTQTVASTTITVSGSCSSDPSSTTTTSSSASASPTLTCGATGYDLGNPPAYYYDASLNTFDQCSAKCAADTQCESFAIGSACLLYTLPVSSVLNPVPNQGSTFYDEACPAPVTASTTTTTTSAVSTTASISSTTSAAATSTTSSIPTTLVTSTTTAATTTTSSTSSACTPTQTFAQIASIHTPQQCVPNGYYQATDYGTTTEDSLVATCEQSCNASAQCAAFVAQVTKAADSGLMSGQCYYYPGTPSPNACVNGPTDLLAYQRTLSTCPA